MWFSKPNCPISLLHLKNYKFGRISHISKSKGQLKIFKKVIWQFFQAKVKK